MEITLFYIPFGSLEEAVFTGNQVVEKHLAACANIFPVQSVFPWEGLIQHEEEFILLLKTLPDLKENLRNFISSSHSYKTPAILSWSVEVNESYGRWMSDQLGLSNP